MNGEQFAVSVTNKRLTHFGITFIGEDGEDLKTAALNLWQMKVQFYVLKRMQENAIKNVSNVTKK